MSPTMASLEVDSYGIPAVTDFVGFFEEALDTATSIKPEATVEPALEESDLEQLLSQLPTTADSPDSRPTTGPRQRNNSKFATIETAARGLLSNLIVRRDLTSCCCTPGNWLTMLSPASRSTPPTSSKSGTSSTYYNASPTADSVTQPYSYGSSKSSSTVRPSRDVARSLIIWSRVGSV